MKLQKATTMWLRVSRKSTEQQVVVLPGCMRADILNCKAKEWTLGLRCQHCTAGCQVSEITHLGTKCGFETSFVIHQSSFVSHVKDLIAFRQTRNIGILGVACVLSLLEGGFLLESYNVPAQCVPLDFCGCTSRWHDQGIVTCVNVERILYRLR